MRSFSSVLVLGATLARSEMVELNNLKIEPLALQVLQGVTVAATADAPGHFQVDSYLSKTGEGEEKLPETLEHSGLQILLIEKSWLENSSKDAFCCTKEDVENGKCKYERDYVGQSSDGPAFAAPVALQAGQLTKLTVKTSGLYLIAMVHCGEDSMKGFTVSGSVETKSAHGYLPAMDVPAMHFCGFSALFYAGMAVGWASLMYKQKDQLVTVHYMLAAVLGVATVASLAKYLMYTIGNSSGMSPLVSEVAADVCGITKFGVGIMAAVMIALGYGTAHEAVGGSDMVWLFSYAGVFCAVAGLRSTIMGLRIASLESHIIEVPAEFPNWAQNMLSVRTVLVLPEAIVFGSFANWGWASLSNLMTSLEEQKQHETLKMMVAFRRSLIMAVVALLGLVAAQLSLEVSFDFTSLWHTLWILDEMMPNLIFTVALMTSLWAFWPTSTFRVKAMSQQINFDDAELDDIIGGSNSIELVDVDPEKGSEGNDDRKFLE